jgi:hypothetical protein
MLSLWTRESSRSGQPTTKWCSKAMTPHANGLVDMFYGEVCNSAAIDIRKLLLRATKKTGIRRLEVAPENV